MRPADVAEILLVRAVEEEHPEAIEPALLVDALEAAGSPDDSGAWLARRARFLCDTALVRFRPLLAMPRAGWSGLGVLTAGAFLFGIASHSLGPVEQIHVVANPIAILIGWNLIAYGFLAAGALLRLVNPAGEVAATVLPPSRSDSAAAPRNRPAPPSWRVRILGRAVPWLWLRWQKGRFEAEEQGRVLQRVARAFWRHWTRRAMPVFEWSTRRALHLAALSMGAGAVAGTFLRGLFFDYHLVWRSTFVREPETAAHLLDLLLGPAARLLGRAPPTAADLESMMSAGGVEAGPWMILYALAAALWIGIPRAALALRASRRLRRLGPEVDLGTGDPYTRSLLEQARSHQLVRITDRIQEDVESQSMRFAERVGAHVAEAVYDRSIVPRLERFRQEGGSLEALEQDVGELARSSQEDIERFLDEARRDFEEQLADAVRVRLDLAAPVHASPALTSGEVVRESGSTAQQVGQQVGLRLADVVGSAVSTGVALGIGALSGGFGKALGTAIVVTLLHTTGPVGFVIGAVAGLVGAGGAYLLGRERAAGALRSVSLPAVVVRGVLSAKRFDRLVQEGRESCRRSVRDLVLERLRSLAPELAQRIWTELKPLVGQQRRPVSRPQA